jgi:hypothetical protein
VSEPLQVAVTSKLEIKGGLYINMDVRDIGSEDGTE